MVGKNILHYKIIEKLGEGGMGIIYLAEDNNLKRKVALKLLSPYLTIDKEVNERFQKEAQIVASLNHPNIVTIYEINNFEKQYYLSLEYLEGENLRQKFPSEYVSMESIMDISLQICNGLNKAHNSGIIHRDIKPENIFITKDGLVKILDFGLAKLKGSSGISKEKIAGTISYMSPEQIQGEDVDHRTDIWSFGVLLYEMISGGLPFKGDYDQAIIYSILNEEPQQINQKLLSIPDEMKEIIIKCLNKSKEGRYNAVEEIITELKKINKTLSQGTDSRTSDIIDFISEIFKPSESFTAREAELKSVNKKIEDAFRGKGFTVFIQGEPGIGKSQLVYQAANYALSLDMNVLLGRCVFNEGGLPYHPFISSLKTNIQPALGSLGNKFLTTLSGHANRYGINLSGSLPFIKSFLGLSEGPISLLNKEQLWNAIFSLFQIIAIEKPLVLILEDLQWADKTTLGLFSFIARNSANLPLLLIGIHRPPEIVPLSRIEKTEVNPLTESIRQLRIEDLAEQIILERFDEEETEILVRRLFNSPVGKNLIKKIFQHTEGNPLFISELVKLLKDKNYVKFEGEKWRLSNNKISFVPTEKVQDVIHQRVDRLEKDLREILEVASCEGEYFQSETLAACLNINKISLLKSLNTLEKEHHLIRHEKNRYKFDHILIKEVLYRNILDELRDEYHRMIADYIINQYGTNDEFASPISYHLLASGKEEKAINYLIRAADRARELHAVEDATNYYQKVDTILTKIKSVDTTLRLKVEEGLGDMLSLTGNTESALEHFNIYLKAARKVENQIEEIKALRKISKVFRIKGKINDAFKMCEEALTLAKTIKNKPELIHCINTMAFTHASKGEYNLTIELSKEALTLSNELSDSGNLLLRERNQSISFSNIGFAYWHMGNYPSAMEYLNHALRMQHSIGDSLGLSTTLNYLGLAYWKFGEYKKALDSAFESVKIKKSIGDYLKIPGSLNVIGDIYRDLNDISKAIDFHSESLSLAREHQNKGAMCDNIRDLGEDYFLLGDTDKALKYFEEVLELAKSAGIMWYETRTYISLSELYNFIDSNEKASYYSDLGLGYANKIKANDLIIEALWNQAKVKATAENKDEIRKLYLQAIEIAESVGHNTFLWQLYNDFSNFLKNNSQFNEMIIYRDKSKNVLNKILDNLDSDLKKTFLQSEKVKEVFEFAESH